MGVGQATVLWYNEGRGEHDRMNQTNYDKLKQAAQDMKDQEIQLCEEYLARAKGMGLSDKSATIRKWKNLLTEWQELPIYLAMQSRDAIEASGLTASEVEEVLANL